MDALTQVVEGDTQVVEGDTQTENCRKLSVNGDAQTVNRLTQLENPNKIFGSEQRIRLNIHSS